MSAAMLLLPFGLFPSVSDANTFKCLAEKNGGKIPETFPGNDALKACAESSDVVPFDFGGFRAGQWSDGNDEFYKDFRNRGLDIQLAMRYVREQLHGKPLSSRIPSTRARHYQPTSWGRTPARLRGIRLRPSQRRLDSWYSPG